VNLIGTNAKPVDWAKITSGTAQYADDIDLPGLLHGAVLRSPHAHARIVAIDVSAARALPGVHAVLTSADLPDRQYIDYRPADSDRYPLAKDVVRHVGEPVAIVAADDPATAERALAAIRVTYKVLPTLATVEEALKPGAPAIHAKNPDNVASRIRREFGDQKRAREATRHAISARYISSRQTHATMEPHTVLAHWRADENRLHMWIPSQNPRKLQTDVAHVLALEKDRVRLHELAVGGDFGGRSQISSTEVLVGALSMATGKPVKLKQNRHEEFAFTKSRFWWDTRIRIGCDDDGRVTFLNADYDVDNCAYNFSGPGEMEYGSVALGSSYRWLSYTSSGRCVYTNKQSPSSFRGAGGFQVNWTLECAMDELADEIGMDPIDLRLLNAVSEVGETAITGWEIHSSRLKACLEAVREKIGWDEKRRAGGNGRGVGVACSIHVTGLHRQHMVTSSAALDVGPDGHVTLRSGVGDAGTGQKTIIAQAVGEILGIPLDDISVLSTDTGLTPPDAGAGASRGTYHSVHAAKKAATELRDALIGAAADKFHADPADVRWADGHAEHDGDRVSMGDLAALLSTADDGSFSIESEFVGPYHDAAEDGYENIAPSYAFAAHAVEVEVDTDTGAVKVLRVVAAHDSGTIINRNTARGQVEGGVLMGLGAALSEEMIYEGGRAVNPAYVDYALPRSTDAPDIETIFLECDDPEGPFGAKGLGEIVLLPTGPALTTAVSHAIGVRIREAPLTPDRVLRALRRRDGLPETAGRSGGSLKRLWIAGMRRSYPLGVHKLLERGGPKLKASPPAGRVERVLTADSAEDAVRLLREQPGAVPMGGGTDVLVREKQGLPVASTLVQLRPRGELTDLRTDDTGALVIGGAVTLEALETDDRVGEAIRATVREIATPQLRGVATLAGNLCQAKRCWFYRNGFDCYKRGGTTRPCYAVQGDHRFYHAVEGGHRCQAVTPSDLATTLIALDAELTVAGPRGERKLAVEHLYTGPGEVGLTPEEVIVRVTIPAQARARSTVYRKFSLWKGAFAVATVGVSAEVTAAGTLRDVRAVLGGVAPTPARVRDAETLLEGARVTPSLLEQVAEDWLCQTQPLPGNHWKAFATANLLKSALRALVQKEEA